MTRRVIDLSFPIHEGMTTFPTHWHPMVEVSILGRHGIEERETRKIVLGTHTGTHCDAPRHFIPDGATIDQIPLDVFVGPAEVLDLTDIGTLAVTVEHLQDRLKNRHADRVVLRYGWCSKWGKLSYYNEHPYLDESAAQWLVDRGVKLVGMDTPMPDNSKNGRGTVNDSPIHKILLGNGLVLVEYMCNLNEIKKPNVELVVLPLKIVGGDGAPARCIAIES